MKTKSTIAVLATALASTQLMGTNIAFYGSTDSSTPYLWSSTTIKAPWVLGATPGTSDAALWQGKDGAAISNGYIAVDGTYTISNFLISGTGGNGSNLHVVFDNSAYASSVLNLSRSGSVFDLNANYSMSFYFEGNGTINMTSSSSSISIASTSTAARTMDFGAGVSVYQKTGTLTINGANDTTTDATIVFRGLLNVKTGLSVTDYARLSFNGASSHLVTGTGITISGTSNVQALNGAQISAGSGIAVTGASSLTVGTNSSISAGTSINLSGSSSLTTGANSSLSSVGSLTVGDNSTGEVSSMTIGGTATIGGTLTLNQRASLNVNSGATVTAAAAIFGNSGTAIASYADKNTVTIDGTLNITGTTGTTISNSNFNSVTVSSTGKLNVAGGTIVFGGNSLSYNSPALIVKSANNAVNADIYFAEYGKIQIEANNNWNSTILVRGGSGITVTNGTFEIDSILVINRLVKRFTISVNDGATLIIGALAGTKTSGSDTFELYLNSGSSFVFEQFYEHTILVKDLTGAESIFDTDGSVKNMSITGRSTEKLYFTAYDSESGGYWLTTTAVPEPAAWAAIIGAVALGFAVYRRRK